MRRGSQPVEKLGGNCGIRDEKHCAWTPVFDRFGPMNQKVLVCLAFGSLLACGDDGGTVHKIPDARPVDAQSCVAGAVDSASLDFDRYVAPDASQMFGGLIGWFGDGGMVEGNQLQFIYEFWAGYIDLTGTIDL